MTPRKVNFALKDKRQRSFKSQREVGTAIGISENAYGQKEIGEREFKQNEMIALAEYFDCTLDELFREDKVNVKV